MTTKYRHLFFDLDHTLWDFEANSKEALRELYAQDDWQAILGVEAAEFLNTYYRHNDFLWAQYREGKVTKEKLRHQRFVNSFQEFGYTDLKKILAFEAEYMALAPRKTKLFPGALETLSALKERYQLHIITNGFEETQIIKIASSGLQAFFSELVCSDQIGVNKPQARIFIEALNRAGATRKESLMIGDNLGVDILGARDVGMDQVYFNPAERPHQEKPSYEIRELPELLNFL